ncbi:MAG: chemotaxis protein CheW, partial [Scytonema sp. PMC 1069.18]|nr:chemotaxis protein CheW [Scytonema sp. PMC 1069.18]
LTNSETLYLVIVQVDNYRFGLVVDSIEDIQDIVVKPLGKQLRALSLFAGATILGDGGVILIIDIVGLASKACVSAQLQQLTEATAANVPNQEGDRQMVLLFQGPSGTRMGIPLTMTLRLEEIPRSAVEKVGNQYVVQIYNRILPLIDLHNIFSDNYQNQFDDGAFATEGQTLQVAIVSPFSELSVGLVVDRILDIVEEPMTIKGVASRPGVLFSTVIQGQITEILDIEAVIRIANPYLLQVSERG